MKRLQVVPAVLFLLAVTLSSALAAVPVTNQFRISAKVATLTAGQTYLFTFRLFDAATGGNQLFSETKSYAVPASKTISHLLGSVNFAQPLRAEYFLQQVWVQVSTGAKVFPRVKLSPAPLAIGSQNADLLDGFEATEFSAATHTHGGPGSGLDADLLDGHDGSFYQDAANLTGSLSDGRLSANVELLTANQTVTGIKTFDPATGSGTPPFAVAASKRGAVGNLNADLLDGLEGASYRDAGNMNSGVLGTDRYSAYADLGAEGHLGDGAGDLALNNGVLQPTLYAQRAQSADSAETLGAAAQAALDARYGLATPSQGLTGYATRVGVATYGVAPSITIGADALPIVAYVDSISGDLRVLHCSDAACSSGITTTVDSTVDVGLYTSITIGADGLPVISYYDSTNYDLRVLHCGTVDCSSGNNMTAADSSPGAVGEYNSITIGADGLPVISYYDGTNSDLKVLHCGTAECSSGNSINAADSIGYVGTATSITIGADGLPVISYRDGNTSRLKVLHCSNANCSAGDVAPLVDTALVGWSTSITIGADALPVVAFHVAGGTDLRVLHCGTADCSSGNTATTVDSIGDVGLATSITIGADGLPLISYHDTTKAILKVLHCGNAACSAGNTTTAAGTTGAATPYSSITVGADGRPVISYYDHTDGKLQVVRILYKPLGRR